MLTRPPNFPPPSAPPPQVFIELFFILTSMWMHQFYYLFGFLALVRRAAAQRAGRDGWARRAHWLCCSPCSAGDGCMAPTLLNTPATCRPLPQVFIILIITCAEITIVLAYFQLCSGELGRP